MPPVVYTTRLLVYTTSCLYY